MDSDRFFFGRFPLHQKWHHINAHIFVAWILKKFLGVEKNLSEYFRFVD